MVLLASSSASAHFCCVHVSGPWFYNALVVSHIPQVVVDARNMNPKCNEIYNLLACNKGPPMGMRMVIITTCHCLHTAHNILYLGTLSDHRYSPADHHVHRNNIPQHLTTASQVSSSSLSRAENTGKITGVRKSIVSYQNWPIRPIPAVMRGRNTHRQLTRPVSHK